MLLASLSFGDLASTSTYTALGERQRRDTLNNWQDEGDYAACNGRCTNSEVKVSQPLQHNAWDASAATTSHATTRSVLALKSAFS